MNKARNKNNPFNNMTPAKLQRVRRMGVEQYLLRLIAWQAVENARRMHCMMWGTLPQTGFLEEGD